ncbi:Gfo/Idh/MocA family protein [Flavilitoribacter nigricans]|uniref:Oxidoreductase n=1 Tax=Flavilitoribacter nigricans (strain ATCC 23147 / DSM 23189 / NBRC 102662 / NCIMB 1420 / SS-2) TaxID=1122177 RepID=A0A2D0NDF7_FLAN2|nr:Gfo/Idh/MocA family oxidoreductase [Flavilitoribacter nigricans]PHN06410.1 oxidoreductase [Flavilitoribacter nigricans DSM 23189 = NBRC 102662]
MSETFNWGIIGAGRIARKFASDLKTIKNARLSAVASRDQGRAQTFADEYSAPYAYGTYEEILDCPELDAVYIATRHPGHAAASILCLDKGIPVLCEKPFAMNTGEVEQMIAAARRSNTFLMEAIWTRFLPTTRQALKWIAEGKIGEVQSVKADFGFKAERNLEGRLYNKELGGGSLLDIGIYPTFLSLLLLGKPQEILAHGVIGPTGIDEEMAAIFTYEGGKMAQIHSTIRADTKTEAFIYGSEGVIHIHSRWHEPTSMSLLLPGERPQDVFFDYPCIGYAYEAEEVMSCLAEGKKESEALPLSFSLDLIQLLDSMREKIGLTYRADS